MTAAQLRNITVKHDIHPDAPVYVDVTFGLAIIPIVGYSVVTNDVGRKVLILETRKPDGPAQRTPENDPVLPDPGTDG